MSLGFAALGAVVAALLEISAGPYLQVAGGQPHLVLAFAVVWTVIGGIDGGLVWAFVGGLSLDFLAFRPLGSTAFALLIVVGAAALLARFLGQLHLRYVAPVVVVIVLSPFYSLLLLGITDALTGAQVPADAVTRLAPGLVYDVALGAALTPLGFALHRRITDVERVDW